MLITVALGLLFVPCYFPASVPPMVSSHAPASVPTVASPQAYWPLSRLLLIVIMSQSLLRRLRPSHSMSSLLMPRPFPRPLAHSSTIFITKPEVKELKFPEFTNFLGYEA